MKTKFRNIAIGEEFTLNGDRFIKTDNTIYPPRVPLSSRYHNCINLTNKHRIVMGNEVIVDTYEDNEEDI